MVDERQWSKALGTQSEGAGVDGGEDLTSRHLAIILLPDAERVNFSTPEKRAQPSPTAAADQGSARSHHPNGDGGHWACPHADKGLRQAELPMRPRSRCATRAVLPMVPSRGREAATQRCDAGAGSPPRSGNRQLPPHPVTAADVGGDDRAGNPQAGPRLDGCDTTSVRIRPVGAPARPHAHRDAC